MNRLTEDLLALASVESPDYKLTPLPTRASALLNDAIETFGALAADSKIEPAIVRRAGCAGDGRPRCHESGIRQPH